MTKLLHLLHLDAVGGVENLFYSFIISSSIENHHLLITNKEIHPQFEELQNHITGIDYLKYWKRFRIPRFLRKARSQSVFKKVNPDRVVLWNTFSEAFSGSENIYYDHGAAWVAPDNLSSQRFLSQIERFIACSEASKRVLQLRWGIEKQIDVVRNAIRPHLTSHTSSSLIPRNSSPLRLGAVGRLVPLKGFSLAIHAVKLLLDQGVAATLFIAGEGPEKERLQQTAKDLDISTHIVFLGTVRNMEAFYHETDILLCPSLKDTLSLASMEAQQYGCPVVCSCIDGFPEAVAHSETGYCIPPTLPLEEYSALGGAFEKIPPIVYDPTQDTLTTPKLIAPNDLADAIIKVAHNLPEMSQQTVERARQEFGFSHYVEQLEAALCHVA